MPEGPECRKIGEELAKFLSNKTLTEIEILSGRYTKKQPSGLNEFKNSLPLKVVGAGVHGKFIYVICDNGWSIWSTLGMSGQWSKEKTKHARLRFHTTGGDVFYNDMRNFGTVKFEHGRHKLIEKLKSLGPDMLSDSVDDKLFISRLRTKGSEKTITEAVMQQSIIAGVGNYIKADSLWLAKISPHRKVKDLSDSELTKLNNSIQTVMKESYNTGGATIRTYKNFDNEKGEYNRRFLVYNQKTDPDGNPVKREQTKDKRTTHWVPTVQK